jgi:alanine racemase
MHVTQPTPPHDTPSIEINLDNVVHNLSQIRAMLPPEVGIIAVVKDNAYGCGSVMVSRVLEAHTVRFFAVARTCEARILREGGIASPILVLGPASLEELTWGAGADICFSLNDVSDWSAWTSLTIPVRFHINVDTGMGRLGILPQETKALAVELKDHEQLKCDGLYTHCAKADDADSAPTALQRKSFMKALHEFQAQGLNPSVIHYANSAAAMRHPLDPSTMVRPGIALYGCKPDPAQDFPLDLKPVLSLKARVIKIKRVPAGTAISYGGTYLTASDTTVATIGLGYGHGLPRQLGNNGSVLIRGRRYPIAGRVTMDYIMVDSGPDPVITVGDEVIAIGSQGDECISPDELALQCKTIAYEILCAMNRTIDRHYILNGREILHEPCRPF